MLGEDFKAAMTKWLYPVEPLQGFWRGLGLSLLLLAVFEFLMVPILGAVISTFAFGLKLQDLVGPTGIKPEFFQGVIAGMFPAMLLLCLLSWGLVQRGLPNKQGRLPLAWPKLGLGGWLLIIFGFLISVGLMLFLVFKAAGADPVATKGLIEKSVEELAGNKARFALVVPGVVLGAPVAEELLFRGFLFSALLPTRLGKTGTVLITAALWALAHAGPAPWVIVTGIFLMGLVLGVVLLRFGSLWVTIVLHALWNGLQVLGLFSVGSQ